MIKRHFLLILLLCLLIPTAYAEEETAIFAGGCFWCTQADFDKERGVINTTVGFDGGTRKQPTYEIVSSGKTNYTEVVKVSYDPKVTPYPKLLDFFWRHVDPTAYNAQFCDHGRQYRSAIFYLNETQKRQALDSLNKVKKLFPKVYTEISPSTQFYPAAVYHQDYYKKYPLRYRFYRWNCGRDAKLKDLWMGKENIPLG